jgi:hypothetical protein
VNKNTSLVAPGSKITAAAATIDTIIERRMENAAEGPPSNILNLLYKTFSLNKENVLILCDYISSLKSEINLSDHYRKDIITLLCKFSAFNNAKSFKDITREDLLSFLDSFRKVDTVDPLHKWIGTYNTYVHLQMAI